MEFLVSSAIFVGLFSLVYLAGLLLKNRGQGIAAEKPGLFSRPAFGRATQPLASLLPLSRNKREKLSQELVSAGYYHFFALNNFLAKRNLAVLSVILLLVSLFAIGIADGIEIVVAITGIIICIAVFSIPRLVLSSQATRRVSNIEKAIPDALDMMAMSIAGGLPLASAVERVAHQLHKTHASLAQELRIITRQSQSGSTDVAFSSFAKRINLPEVIAWCSLMRQSQRLGGRLVDSLTDYANRIREDRKNRAEKAGNTASIKLLLPVITCICPPIAIMLIGPAILDLRDFINREGNIQTQVIEQINSIRNQSQTIIDSQGR